MAKKTKPQTVSKGKNKIPGATSRDTTCAIAEHAIAEHDIAEHDISGDISDSGAAAHGSDSVAASFCEFLWIWNASMSLSTPALHRRMAVWLDECYSEGRRHLLLQAFRAAGKSTICGLFAAWLLYRQPDIRIMILAAEHHLATKMVRNVKHIIEHHPLISDLKPSHPEQWAASELTVRRRSVLRDPSVVAQGIGGNFTGSRADMIICDDVEVPTNCDSVKKRQDLRERLHELDYVISPGGGQLYIGTPHSYYSIYADSPRREVHETRAFLADFCRLSIPLLDASGGSAWEQKFPLHYIESLRRRQGPNKFSSQMLLCPLSPRASRLNPDYLRCYSDDLSFRSANGFDILSLNGVRLVSSSCWWDPAFGDGGDGSVIACVFTDSEGRYYLHDLLSIVYDCHGKEDNARQQCRRVVDFMRRNYQFGVHVETNGLGKFLPALLRQILEEERYGASVMEEHTGENKGLRIVRAFDALLAARQLYISERAARSGFIQELREWDMERHGGRDDSLDAVAGCINSEPLRLPRRFASYPRLGWGSAMRHDLVADTHFEV